MIFRHQGRDYPNASLQVYRTPDMNILVVRAPPGHRLVFIDTFEETRLADPGEVQRLAARYKLRGLATPRRAQPASAA